MTHGLSIIVHETFISISRFRAFASMHSVRCTLVHSFAALAQMLPNALVEKVAKCREDTCDPNNAKLYLRGPKLPNETIVKRTTFERTAFGIWSVINNKHSRICFQFWLRNMNSDTMVWRIREPEGRRITEAVSIGAAPPPTLVKASGISSPLSPPQSCCCFDLMLSCMSYVMICVLCGVVSTLVRG